jgi:nickel transport protein
MADRMRGLRGAVVALVVALAAVATAGPAAAHALKVFALVEGETIKGTAYFAGAAPARRARITVYGPDNAVLAEAVSGEDGAFALPAGPPVDHRIVADAGDGHAAQFLIRAAELNSVAAADEEATRQAPHPANLSPNPPNAASGGSIEATVEAVVSRHVSPLREQLNAYEDRLRWHDVLGGIGYILGLSGLAAFFLSRRRRER